MASTRKFLEGGGGTPADDTDLVHESILKSRGAGSLQSTPLHGLRRHMLGCLASGRTNVRCVCLLQDGAVSILSPPVPPTQSSAHVQQLRLADPVEAIACSTDGAFLAVASRTELRVYAVAEGASTSDGEPRAHLRWRAPLNAHVRGLAINGSAALPSVVVAVGGAPGLRLLVGGGGNDSGSGEGGGEDSAVGHGEGGGGAAATLAHRGVLHAGRAVCGCPAPPWLDEPTPTPTFNPSPSTPPTRCAAAPSLTTARCWRWRCSTARSTCMAQAAALLPGGARRRRRLRGLRRRRRTCRLCWRHCGA